MTWLVDADVQEPVIATGVVATGGTESVIRVGGQLYRLHTFKATVDESDTITSVGTLSVTTGGKVEALVVAGGGGGGWLSWPPSPDIGASSFVACGGGGGGGVIQCVFDALNSSSYTVTVGAGGDRGTFTSDSTSGADSSISLGAFEIRSKGGGKGGNATFALSGNALSDGADGGSSGGGSVIFGSSNYADEQSNAGSRVFGQGNNGASPSATRSGGGGGASQPGKELIKDALPDGGDGIASTITGSVQYYGGGGGGAYGSVENPLGASLFDQPLPSGGLGGGGTGIYFLGSSSRGGGQGELHTGGGGAGAAYNRNANNSGNINGGARGGSGIVIIRYPIEG